MRRLHFLTTSIRFSMAGRDPVGRDDLFDGVHFLSFPMSSLSWVLGTALYSSSNGS